MCQIVLTNILLIIIITITLFTYIYINMNSENLLAFQKMLKSWKINDSTIQEYVESVQSITTKNISTFSWWINSLIEYFHSLEFPNNIYDKTHHIIPWWEQQLQKYIDNTSINAFKKMLLKLGLFATEKIITEKFSMPRHESIQESIQKQKLNTMERKKQAAKDALEKYKDKIVEFDLMMYSDSKGFINITRRWGAFADPFEYYKKDDDRLIQYENILGDPETPRNPSTIRINKYGMIRIEMELWATISTHDFRSGNKFVVYFKVENLEEKEIKEFAQPIIELLKTLQFHKKMNKKAAEDFVFVADTFLEISEKYATGYKKGEFKNAIAWYKKYIETKS